LRFAQRLCLRFPASLGDRLREVREQHGRPKPERDLKLEGCETAREKQCREKRTAFDEEHHRITPHRARVQLYECIDCRATHELRIERRFLGGFHQNTLPACIRKCSTSGPSDSIGKYVSAPTITITPTRRNVNSGPSTGNVPADSATRFFAASEPAMPITGMIMKKRPKNIATPR